MRLCTAFLIAVLAAAPASAATQVELRTSGDLEVTWHGDPARGCEQAGVCDVAGSVALAADDGDVGAESTGGGVLELLSVPVQQATVRVLRGDPQRPQGVCLDALGPLELRVKPVGARDGRTRVALADARDPFRGGLSAGRCAGPLPRDLAAALPRGSVRTAALRGGSVTLDLSGRRPFAAGAFAGTVDSTLKLRARISRSPSRASNDRIVSRTGRTARRFALLRLTYRATPGAGALVERFHGGPAGSCEALDACGLSGTATLALTRPFTLELGASIPMRGRRRAPTVAGALAALRAGRGELGFSPTTSQLQARLSAEVTRADGTACRDSIDVALPPLLGATGNGRTLSLRLGDAHYAEPTDPLRTRCPGPARSPDRDGPLATTTLPAAQVGAPRLSLAFIGRSVRDPDLRTVPGDALRLELRRTRASVTIVRVG